MEKRCGINRIIRVKQEQIWRGHGSLYSSNELCRTKMWPIDRNTFNLYMCIKGEMSALEQFIYVYTLYLPFRCSRSIIYMHLL